MQSCYGPLYHLTERLDRVRTLTEVRRVLRPDGVVAPVAITRYASAVVGIVHGWIWISRTSTWSAKNLPRANIAGPQIGACLRQLTFTTVRN